MLNNILEISETTTKGGRVPVKIALLKIADGDINETNKNGHHFYTMHCIFYILFFPMKPILIDRKSVV